MLELEQAIKALSITDKTVLFVDIDQILVRVLEKCESLRKNLLIVGVVGSPNVEAMTEQELQSILDPEEVIAQFEEDVEELTETLCGFESWNELDGENYRCMLPVHGPKVKHGCWRKI